MKLFKNIPLLMVAMFFLFTACRTEDEEIITPPEQISSTTANLINRTATNDGSNDNILDNASCLSIQLPVTVIVDGLEIIIDSEDDLDVIEAIFDEFDDDIDELDFVFPITIILSDFTEITITNAQELQSFIDDCSGENESDDDIECIDFQYPITYAIFNQNNELIETVTITNDQEHYVFIDNLDDSDVVTINFPLTLILSDGNTVTVNNISQLEDAIEDAIDDCDEDDDNDYNDDDCENCTTDQLASILTECPSWEIDKLERNDNDLEDSYNGVLYSFSTDGTITIDDDGVITNGTWNAVNNTMTNSIEVTIDVAGDANVSDTWMLHEIEEETGEVKVDLRIGDDDRLRFESTCEEDGNNGGENTFLEDVLTAENSVWIVSSYVEDTNDETADFNGFEFEFNIDGTATATNGGTVTNGTWAHINNETELLLNFGTSIPLDELQDDWDIISVTETQVELQDVSGGNGGTDTLILTKI
ncbi:hypothetical protein [uncultured Dokdonia sp.]|uniref:hypothetical protein n=1 Tax=uncultured Dokdonia sp. TaxID=575653 RepID=UPI00262C0AAF|nr:hypothetical protein [uncultured Dokdonia sp.]